MATQTPNYNLDLYETGDAAALTDQYNSAMRKIDSDLKTFNQGITVASNAANANTAKLNALGATDNTTAAALKTKIDTTATTATTANATANANTAKLNALGATDNTTAAAIKTKIDTTATTATTANATANANTAKLNALGADTTSNASALKTKIDDTATSLSQNYYTKTQIDTQLVTKLKQRLINPYGATIVCIGDSYGQGYKSSNEATKNPYAVMGNILHATIHNYSDGGAGFVVQSNNVHRNYTDQINYAATQLNTASVDIVMITGGQNDAGQNDITNTVKTTVQNAHTKFPNAQIVVYPMQWPAYQFWDNATFIYTQILQGVAQAGCATFVPYGFELLLGDFNLISDDQKHPNDAGYEIMGGKFASVLQGGYGGETKISQFTPINGTQMLNNKSYARLNAGTITYGFWIKPNQTNTTKTLVQTPKFFNFNQWEYPYHLAVQNSPEPTVIAIQNWNTTGTSGGTINLPFGTSATEIYAQGAIDLLG